MIEVERLEQPVPTVILERNSTQIANWRIDEQNGEEFQVFFVVAPDGLCYYFL
jgi:hypothetical protein